jgi:hypothetical protein
MLAQAERVLRLLAVVSFALCLVALLPRAAKFAVGNLVLAAQRVGESPRRARERRLGTSYVEAIEAIRRAIPEDGDYLLVNFGEPWEGGPYWVRFELAPRRARYLGEWRDLPGTAALADQLEAGPQWVVAAFSDGVAPNLYDHAAFLEAVRRRRTAG